MGLFSLHHCITFCPMHTMGQSCSSAFISSSERLCDRNRTWEREAPSAIRALEVITLLYSETHPYAIRAADYLFRLEAPVTGATSRFMGRAKVIAARASTRKHSTASDDSRCSSIIGRAFERERNMWSPLAWEPQAGPTTQYM